MWEPYNINPFVLQVSELHHFAIENHSLVSPKVMVVVEHQIILFHGVIVTVCELIVDASVVHPLWNIDCFWFGLLEH